MPAAIMGLDAMESYVEIIRPECFPPARSRRLGILGVVENRLKYLYKLVIRSTAKGSSQSRGPIRELLVHRNDSTSLAEGSDYEARSAQTSPETCHTSDDKGAKNEEVCLVEAGREIDRISSEICCIRNDREEDAKMVIKHLDEAMDLLQSNNIAKSRDVLRDIFEIVSKIDSSKFKTPSGYDLQVLERGEELFWTWGGQRGVSCSVKHGIIILDSGNPLFYPRLFNVLGAFATETSEFQIAEKSFSILIDLHGQSDSTSRLRGMGASFNNRGCILMIRGEYNRARSDFQNSQRHFNFSKNKQFCGPSIDSLMIAVENNICRLDMLCRYFSKALTGQERLAEKCKARDNGTLVTRFHKPQFQTTFMVLLNQATMYNALAMFPKAEKELRFLKKLCENKNREEFDFLLNFLQLRLHEVLLLRAKQEKGGYPLEMLTSASVYDLLEFTGLQSFEGLHLNVRIESFETLVDVLVQTGKIKFASELLQKGSKIVENVFGPNHFNVAALLYKQGTILKLIGEVPKALRKFEEAKEIWRGIFGENHPLLISCYMSLGDISLRLDPGDESHLYFQRAMENVQIIHHVSLLEQLSKRYFALTRKITDISLWESERRERQEGIVEGLVAEYGLALAVLVNRLGIEDTHASRKKKEKGKQPQVVKHSEFTLIISQKFMRDLLQSGKKFLQHGMTKEAFAFFKEASRYGMTNNIACPNAALVHLCTIISQAKLTSQNKLESPALRSYLEDVKAETENSREGNSEDEDMLTFNNQMTLKLLLIFFLLLSIQLQAHDATFAAYDFYVNQFPNDDQCFLTLDGELQVYASRTSMTCNGQTAVQDLFVSSAIFENKSDWKGHLSGRPLFRSLAYRSNKPSCNLVAALTSPFLMDKDDLKKLEEKVLHSFQEFVQLKCLGFESNVTQAVVDLTSFCKQDIMTCGGRIELLPLCLFEQVIQSKTPIGRGAISEMTPGLCERITCMNFTDKQTTWAMFSKISLWFLKNCTWEDKSTLRPQDGCLVLTFVHPVRARVTLWHKDISIMQKVQVIHINDKTTQLDEIRPEFNFLEDLCSSSSPCCKAIEKFAEPLIRTHGVGCKVSVVRRQCAFSDEPQNSHDKCLEPTVLPSDDVQQEEEDSPFQSEENEEALTTNVQESTLKLLTEISKLSRELSEKEIQPEDEIVREHGKSALSDMPSSPDEESMPCPERVLKFSGAPGETPGSNHFEQASCSYERGTESNDSSSVGSHHSGNTEKDQLSSVKENVVEVHSKDVDVFLGKKLFEEDKESRKSLISEIQERLRKKEMRQERNYKSHHLPEHIGPKDELSSLVEASGDDASQNVFGKNTCSFTNFGGEEEMNGGKVSKGQKTADNINKEKTTEAEDKGRGSSKPLNYSFSQEETWENHTSIEKPAVVIALPSSEETDAIANESCEISTSDSEMVFYDCQHEKRYEVQMGTREINQDENAERRGVDGNGLSQKSESIQTNDKDPSQSKCSIDLNVTANITSTKEAAAFGSLEEDDAYFDVDQSRSLAVRELAVRRAESHVESHCKKSSKNDAKYGGNEEVSIKSGEQNSVLLPMESCLASDCHASNPSPQASEDVIDGSNSPNSSTQDREKVETSSFSASFQRESVAEDNNSSRTFLQTTEEAFSGGPALSNIEYVSNNWMQNNSRSTFYGGDVIADGYTPEVSSQRSEHVRVNPALKAVGSSQPNSKEEGTILEGGRADGGVLGLKNIDERKHIYNHCPNNFGDPDVIDGPVEQTSSNNTDISHAYLNFGGARPRHSLPVAGNGYSASAGGVDLTQAYPPGEIGPGLDPEFVERHAVNNSLLTSRLYNTNVNGATWGDPRESNTQERYFSARPYGTVNSMHRLTAYGPLNSHLSKSSCRRSSKKDVFAGSSIVEGSVRSRTISHVPFPKQDKSWHFPSPPVNSEHCVRLGNLLATDHSDSAKYFDQETLLQDCEPLFDDSTTRSPYQEMRSLADEYMIEQGSQGEAPEHSESFNEEHSVGVSEFKPDSNQGSQETLLECLRTVMSTTVNLFASINVSEGQGKQNKTNALQTQKLSIEEKAVGENCDRTGTVDQVYLREQAASLPRNERTTDTVEEDHTTPVQESPRPACGHYQRRCLVRFPCCGRFYPCHRCHNESAACTDDQARAINATHIRCTICYHEQVIDQGSQQCRGCNSKLADYFCAICKHFTSLDKNPFHCDKCGICRIHRDKSFHCNVCNVCLDKRLQGKHKCRPDSGHDECCICLEDAFSGCQILPCSHKVHKDCAIAMIQNGIRTCPICRHPLFQQSEGSEQ